jgi:hypothetical protein
MLLNVILDQINTGLDGVILDGPSIDAGTCHDRQEDAGGLETAEQDLKTTVPAAGFEVGIAERTEGG